MAAPKANHDVGNRTADARRQAQALAESIDAAAADLAENGPVPQLELARMLADLEAEWTENRSPKHREPTAFPR